MAGASPAWAAGWQSPYTYSVATGLTSLFFHYPCPSKFPVVSSGGFAGNSVLQTSVVSLGYSGPRTDETPANYNEWGWHFYWSGGAPAGTTITFTVYCVK